MKNSVKSRKKSSGRQKSLMRVILWSVSVLLIVCGAVLKVYHQPYGRELLAIGVGLELICLMGLGWHIWKKKKSSLK